MSDTLPLVFVFGLAVGNYFSAWAMSAYRNVLLRCARDRTAEQLPDGRFYYIVPAQEYLDLCASRGSAER